MEPLVIALGVAGLGTIGTVVAAYMHRAGSDRTELWTESRSLRNDLKAEIERRDAIIARLEVELSQVRAALSSAMLVRGGT